MNQTNQYFTKGLWIFVFLTIGALAGIYVAHVQFTVLLFACNIMVIILALWLLLLLMQANKAFVKDEDEITRLKQREKSRLQKEQQTTNHHSQHEEAYRVDDALKKIMPAAGTNFTNIDIYTEKVLQNIAKETDIVQGLVFVLNETDHLFHISGQYAYFSEERPCSFPLGETLSGQVAKSQKLMNLKELPEGYITILSGLGKSAPRHLVIAPIVHNNESIGIIELASFKPLGKNEESLISGICESMADLLNSLRN